MVRILYLAVFLFMSMAQMGQAETIDDTLRSRLLLSMPKARVTTVIDGQTFVVNNSKTIHLPAIYIPWETPMSQGDNGAKAKEFLEKLLADKFVRIYQVRNNDRALFNALGHDEGYVTVDENTFVQQAMVAQGLAFAYPSQSHNVVADILYAEEAKAREAKVGLWSDAGEKIWSDGEVLDQKIKDKFVIVEGTIKKVASRDNVIYLNFGDDWREDFTVAMDSGLRKMFAKQNKNIMQWGGQSVQVRGWVRDYNGPYIEIFDPSQIQLLTKETDENTQ